MRHIFRGIDWHHMFLIVATAVAMAFFICQAIQDCDCPDGCGADD